MIAFIELAPPKSQFASLTNHSSWLPMLLEPYLSSEGASSGHQVSSPQNWVTWLREGQKSPSQAASSQKSAPAPRQSQRGAQTGLASGSQPSGISSTPNPSSNTLPLKPLVLCVDWTGIPADTYHRRNVLGDIMLKNWLQYCHSTDEATGKPTGMATKSLVG
jgi:hypothetical protein